MFLLTFCTILSPYTFLSDASLFDFFALILTLRGFARVYLNSVSCLFSFAFCTLFFSMFLSTFCTVLVPYLFFNRALFAFKLFLLLLLLFNTIGLFFVPFVIYISLLFLFFVFRPTFFSQFPTVSYILSFCLLLGFSH